MATARSTGRWNAWSRSCAIVGCWRAWSETSGGPSPTPKRFCEDGSPGFIQLCLAMLLALAAAFRAAPFGAAHLAALVFAAVVAVDGLGCKGRLRECGDGENGDERKSSKSAFHKVSLT